MRDLKASDKNILRINDARSNTEIELYYRTPSTQEEVQYQNKILKRQGKKVLINAFETRLEMGLKILTGFREGDFGLDGKPLSTEPGSVHYCEGWKEMLKDNASDIVTAFAFTIFEGARPDTGQGLEFGDSEVEEDTTPLVRS